MNKRTYLHLTGGLGNQLFQLAAGLYFAGNSNLYISAENGLPRLNSAEEPELYSFALPQQIEALNRLKYSKFISRVCGYTIRMGVSPRYLERNKMVSFVIRIIASLLNSVYLKYPIKLHKVNGVGYAGERNHANFLIGYFQTFKYADDKEVFEKLQLLKLKKSGNEFYEYVKLARVETPIVVHIRRGDYSKEGSFGLLGKKYYLNAINELISLGEIGSIWVFSDDISAAKNMLDGELNTTIRYFGDIDNSASATMEVMRHGHGFVIGNSSFSWWSAFLRYNREAKVIAPRPWFAGQDEPESLIPKDWQRQDGHHFFISPLELESE